MIIKLYLSAAMQNVPQHNKAAFLQAEETFKPYISLNPHTLSDELVQKFAHKHDLTYGHYLAYDILKMLEFKPNWFVFIRTSETHWSESFGCSLEFAFADILDKIKFEWCTYNPQNMNPLRFCAIQSPQYNLQKLASDIYKRIDQFRVTNPQNSIIYIGIIAEMINYYMSNLNIYSHEQATATN